MEICIAPLTSQKWLYSIDTTQILLIIYFDFLFVTEIPKTIFDWAQ